MPYPFLNVKGKIFERNNLGFSKSKIAEWLHGLANSVATVNGEETLLNKTLLVPTLTAPKINGDNALNANSIMLDIAASKAQFAPMLYTLGKPVAADSDRIVVSTDMREGAYNLAIQPDIPRNVTVKMTAVGTADTPGKIIVTGTNYLNDEITEEIIPEAGVTVAGKKAFSGIISIVGSGWVVDEVEGSPDLIEIGIGNDLGLPIAISSPAHVVLCTLGAAIIAHNAKISEPSTLECSTIDVSGGTYNGEKAVCVFIVN